MNNLFLLSSLGAVAALLAACAPMIPYRMQRPVAPGPEEQSRALQEQQQVERARAEAERNSREAEPEPPKEVRKPADTGKPDYPTAIMIPGKEGYVFNPYTNNPVDVRGIPSRTLVMDPQDPDGDKHRFRVP